MNDELYEILKKVNNEIQRLNNLQSTKKEWYYTIVFLKCTQRFDYLYSSTNRCWFYLLDQCYTKDIADEIIKNYGKEIYLLYNRE